MPTRLIETQPSGLRLIETSTLGTPVQYLTLSHCWGDSSKHKPYMLTQERLESYKESIPEHVLPKLRVEAIRIPRTFSKKYIRIDSLCIIQDSKAGWAAEAAKMWEVYSHSWLNISATKGIDEPWSPVTGTEDVPDSEKSAEQVEFEHSMRGIMDNRSISKRNQVLGGTIAVISEGHRAGITAGTYAVYAELAWKRLVDEGGVNRRAWVQQERMLAQRIVHFAAGGQLFWGCRELRASEAFARGFPPTCWLGDTIPIKKPLGGIQHVPHQHMLTTWAAVVNRYSAAQLTFQSYKLIALSALAQQLLRTYPEAGQYFGGLWETGLLQQLLWIRGGEITHATRADPYRAPSWSWACLDHVAIHANFECTGYEDFGEKSQLQFPASVLSVSYTLADANSPFGSACAQPVAQLTMRGCLLRIRASLPEPRPEKRPGPASGTDAKFAEWVGNLTRMLNPKWRNGDIATRGDDLGLQLNEITGFAGGESMITVGIHAQIGTLVIDGSEGHSQPAQARKHFRLASGVHKYLIYFDTVEDAGWAMGWYTPAQYMEKFSGRTTLQSEADLIIEGYEPLELFFLTVVCLSRNAKQLNREDGEIYAFKGLVLASAELEGDDGAMKRCYRHIGVCNIQDGDSHVVELLCALGNQDAEVKDEDMGTRLDDLPLDEFVPEHWPCKELDFVPKAFKMWETTII